MLANEATDTNANRAQPFSRNLVEQKRRDRTLPAVINGITASEAQAQGLVAEDYSDNDGSATGNDESLFLPDGPAIAEPAKQPNANEPNLLTPAIPWKPSQALSNTGTFLRPSTTPSQISETPKIDISTSPFSGKPSITTTSQPAASQFPDPQSNPPGTVAGPFNNQNRSDPAASLFGSLPKAAFKPPELDFAKPFNSQAQPDLSLKVPSVSETVKSTSTAEPPKLDLGASSPPSPTVTPSRFSTQKQDIHVNLSAKLSPNDLKSKAGESKPSSFGLSDPYLASNTSAATLPSPAPAFAATQDASLKTVTPPFISLYPITAASSLASDERASTSTFSSIQPSTQLPDSSLNPSNDKTTKPSAQPFFQPLSTIVQQPYKAPPSSSFGPDPSPSGINAFRSMGTDTVDPRPAVLDTLAEGLLMEDHGLLQQFIEYTIGPIVQEAFREVEDDRSWERASQWLIAFYIFRRSRLITYRRDPNYLTQHEVHKTLEGHFVEEEAHAKGQRAKSHFCQVNARDGRVITTTA